MDAIADAAVMDVRSAFNQLPGRGKRIARTLGRGGDLEDVRRELEAPNISSIDQEIRTTCRTLRVVSHGALAHVAAGLARVAKTLEQEAQDSVQGGEESVESPIPKPDLLPGPLPPEPPEGSKPPGEPPAPNLPAPPAPLPGPPTLPAPPEPPKPPDPPKPDPAPAPEAKKPPAPRPKEKKKAKKTAKKKKVAPAKKRAKILRKKYGIKLAKRARKQPRPSCFTPAGWRENQAVMRAKIRVPLF